MDSVFHILLCVVVCFSNSSGLSLGSPDGLYLFHLVLPRPACGGPRRGEKEAGDTPEPRPGDCVPRHPLFTRLRRAAKRREKRRGTPPNPHQGDEVPRHPLFTRLRRAAKRREKRRGTPPNPH